mmetsp:Transcript_56835/g.94036  ORF Transcript_56835/g.94036 Transcript_56835/m.94036 type:complete len:210 (-) Transcript_56835:334-963(-)
MLANESNGLDHRIMRGSYPKRIVFENNTSLGRSLQLDAGEQVALLRRLAAIFCSDDNFEQIAEAGFFKCKLSSLTIQTAARTARHPILVQPRQPLVCAWCWLKIMLAQRGRVQLEKLKGKLLSLAPVTCPPESLLDCSLRPHVCRALQIVLIRLRKIMLRSELAPRFAVYRNEIMEDTVPFENHAVTLQRCDRVAKSFQMIRLKNLIKV